VWSQLQALDGLADGRETCRSSPVAAHTAVLPREGTEPGGAARQKEGPVGGAGLVPGQAHLPGSRGRKLIHHL
jgi:hypothetical protein